MTYCQSCNNNFQQERPITYCTNNIEFASILENKSNHTGVDYLFELLITKQNEIEFIIQDSFDFSNNLLCYSIALNKEQKLPSELASYFELNFKNTDTIFINGRLGNELILEEEFKRSSIERVRIKPFFLGRDKSRKITKNEVESLIKYYNRIIVHTEKLRNETALLKFNNSFVNLNFKERVEIAKEIPLKIYMNINIKFGSLVLTPELFQY